MDLAAAPASSPSPVTIVVGLVIFAAILAFRWVGRPGSGARWNPDRRLRPHDEPGGQIGSARGSNGGRRVSGKLGGAQSTANGGRHRSDGDHVGEPADVMEALPHARQPYPVAEVSRQPVAPRPRPPERVAELLGRWATLMNLAPDPRDAVSYLATRSGMAHWKVDRVRKVRNQCAHPDRYGWPSQDDVDTALATANEVFYRLRDTGGTR